MGASGQGADDGGSGGRSRGEGKTVLGTLQGSDGGLEGLAGGVSAAGVVKALFGTEKCQLQEWLVQRFNGAGPWIHPDLVLCPLCPFPSPTNPYFL